MAGQTIQISVLADTRRFTRAMSNLSKKTGLAKLGSAFKAAGKKALSFFKSGIKYAGLLTTAIGGLAIKGGLEKAMGMQKAQATLTGLYGSAKKAKKTMEGLRKVSSKSSIDNSAYNKAAESLAYAGVEGKKAVTVLDHVGKAIVGAGGGSEDLEGASDALLKMVNSGKVQLDSLQEMANANVPILSGLAAHFHTSIDNVNKMASAGKIKLDDVLSVMEKGTGKTWKKQEKSAKQVEKTLGATFSRMKDNALTAIGKYMLPVLDKIAPVLEKVGKSFGKWLTNTAIPAIKDMAKWVGDNLWPVLQDFGQVFMDQIVPAVKAFASEAIATVVPIVKRLWDGFKQNLLPALKRFAGIIMDRVIPAAKSIWDSFKKNVLPVLQDLWDAIQNKVLPAIVDIAGTIVDKVLPVLSDWWDSFTKNVMPPLKRLIDVIKTKVLPIVITLVKFIAQKIIPILLKVAGPIVKTLFKAIGKLIDWLAKLIGWFVDAGKKIWHAMVKAKDKIVSAWDKVQSAFKKAWHWIDKNFIAPWKQIFTKTVPQAFTKAKNKIRDAWHAVVGFFSNAWSKIKHKLDQLKNKIVRWASSALSWLKKAGKDTITGLKDGVAAVIRTIRTWLYKHVKKPIIDYFSKAGSWLKSTGKHVISGLKNGVVNAMKGIVGWLRKHLWNPIKTGVKSLFGIHSPSTEFEWFGKMMIHGLIKGLVKGNPTKFVRKVFGGVTDEARQALAYIIQESGDRKNLLQQIFGAGVGGGRNGIAIWLTKHLFSGGDKEKLGDIWGDIADSIGPAASPGGYIGGAGVQKWSGVARAAMAAAGLPMRYFGLLMHRMAVESGGNPYAINLWDSNAAIGQASRGLMQTIPATFAAYAGPYRSLGIYNPFANIYAAIMYTLARYGLKGIPRAWGGAGGYATGVTNAKGSWAWVGEHGPELMRVPAGSQILDHKKSETKAVASGLSAKDIKALGDYIGEKVFEGSLSGTYSGAAQRSVEQARAARVAARSTQRSGYVPG